MEFDLSVLELSDPIFTREIKDLNSAKAYLLALKEIVESQTMVIEVLVDNVNTLLDAQKILYERSAGEPAKKEPLNCARS